MTLHPGQVLWLLRCTRSCIASLAKEPKKHLLWVTAMLIICLDSE